MLSREAAINLISLISNTNEPVSNIHLKFSSDFSFSEKVSALVNLSFLLSEAILNHDQQVAASWIIYSEFLDFPVDQNPYLSTFLFINKAYISNPNIFCPALCDMIHIMLKNESLSFLNQLTVPQIMDYPFPKCSPIEQKEKQFSQNSSDIETFPCIIIENADNDDFDLTNDDVLIELITNGVFLSSFEPMFPRSPPEVTSIMKEELQVITETDNPPFFLDQNIVSNSKEAAVILLNKSTEEKLDFNETDSLLEGIKKYPSIVETTNFPLPKLDSMIEYNKKIAQVYFAVSIEKRKDLLDFLAKLDISINSVEIIKYLILMLKVDNDFIQNYISQSMISIQEIKDRDDQGIKAMFFCRFILFILNEKKINIQLNQNVLIELRTFCLSTSIRHIPDAQKLLQALML